MKIDRKVWRPISILELQYMSDDEKNKILSYTWDEDHCPRCWTTGITNVKISEPRPHGFHSKNVVDVSWSDNDGDPSLHGYFLDTKIDMLVGDEDYSYGLYVKIEP